VAVAGAVAVAGKQPENVKRQVSKAKK